MSSRSNPTAGPALGLIAGNGRLPFELARAGRAAGLRVVAVGHKNVTDPALASEVDRLDWVRVGQLQKTVQALTRAGADRAVFGGGMPKGVAILSARPDLAALTLWARLPDKGDDRLLRAIADWFAAHGLPIRDPSDLLSDCFAQVGHIAGPKPKAEDLADAERGLALSHTLGALDIGQTVVLREGMVLAVEAMEGTDACIARAGTILGRGVVVKSLKPNQDRRFDLPAIGPSTIDAMARAKARLLAVEAGVTLVLDREEIAIRAKRTKVTIVGLSGRSQPR